MIKPDCIFCQIAAGKAPAQIIYQDETVTAFQDLHPLAPVHILVIPNQHIESVNTVSETDEAVLGHMIAISQKLAAERHVNQTGYRLMINTGPDAGQTVNHIHLHILGGRRLPIRLE
jgi:histidine triad (HIT) family protein